MKGNTDWRVKIAPHLSVGRLAAATVYINIYANSYGVRPTACNELLTRSISVYVFILLQSVLWSAGMPPTRKYEQHVH